MWKEMYLIVKINILNVSIKINVTYFIFFIVLWSSLAQTTSELNSQDEVCDEPTSQ